MDLRKDADMIIKAALQKVMPDEAVAQALTGKCFGEGRVYLAAAGKAAWQMTRTAATILGDRLQAGICVTKYDHVKGDIPKVLCYEAGHPVPDENSFRATQAVLDKLGYHPVILTDQLCCEAREAGSFLASIAKTHQDTEESLAFLAGGETIVHLTGTGKGGRNQELVLAAAAGISGLKDTAVFSIGSDGTDGPTDAAGGYCDEYTKERLMSKGIDIYQVLQENNAYMALEEAGGLIKTGATGTNVNDVAVLLIKRGDSVPVIAEMIVNKAE